MLENKKNSHSYITLVFLVGLHEGQSFHLASLYPRKFLIGLYFSYKAPEEEIPTLCIATACAAKFAEVLEEARVPTCKSEKLEVLRNKDDRFSFGYLYLCVDR